MKNYKKIAPSKLVAKFDAELLNILKEDLKAFRKNNNIRRVGGQNQLTAA